MLEARSGSHGIQCFFCHFVGTFVSWSPRKTSHVSITQVLADGISRVSVGNDTTCFISIATALSCVPGDLNAPTPPAAANVPPQLRQFMSKVAAGNTAACAINLWGYLDCWGDQRDPVVSQVTRVPSALQETTVVDVCVGANHACALTASGSLSCWGGNDRKQLDIPPAAANPGALEQCAWVVH